MIVLDTSVIFKWFDSNEKNRESAKEILRQHFLSHQKIVIPDLLLYEISNAWATKTTINKDEIDINLSVLEKYNLQIQSIDFHMIKKAATFAQRYKVSVYDAVYATLAIERRCDLITADKKFVDKATLPFIKTLSEYKSE